ncbi:hypothetical protein N9954_03050 [Maribacter sp.]|nr:hypothetical protein [Maribacter sp.]
MGLFKKIFGGKEAAEKAEIDHLKFTTAEKKECATLEELIAQNAGLSFEKQLILADVIGSNAWELDMGKGSISFGTLEFPIQIIGSLAFNNNSWMWGWANTQSGIPENLLVQSDRLKEIGQQKNIKELTDGHFTVTDGFEHKIGMMACGIFESKSYYCANYGQGTLVVTIADARIPEVDKSKLEKVLTSFPQLISGTAVDHRIAFESYLIDRGFMLNSSEQRIEGLRNNKIITAEFDDLNRLKSLNGKL